MEFEQANTRAPELYGNHWFNSEPVSIRDLRGHVILLEFWDYTSLDCIRAMSYIKQWSERYRDFGMVAVGVHTPQFAFGRNIDMMQRAIERAGVHYPVVLDNDALLWSAFGVRVWPTRFLIDKDGFIRYSHQGDGGYQQFERALQQLVVQCGYHGRLPDLLEPAQDPDILDGYHRRATGEVFLGYLKGALGNNDGYNPESTIDYVDPGLYLPERFYADGKWLSTRESFSFRGSPGESGSVIVAYDATEVNAVFNSSTSAVGEVLVQQDGSSIPRGSRGEDIVKGSDGASLVLVDSPRLYNLVRNKEFGNHKLTITTSSPGLEIYSFSFATTVSLELIQSN